MSVDHLILTVAGTRGAGAVSASADESEGAWDTARAKVPVRRVETPTFDLIGEDIAVIILRIANMMKTAK